VGAASGDCVSAAMLCDCYTAACQPASLVRERLARETFNEGKARYQTRVQHGSKHQDYLGDLRSQVPGAQPVDNLLLCCVPRRHRGWL
jgi:hypothetical protein